MMPLCPFSVDHVEHLAIHIALGEIFALDQGLFFKTSVVNSERSACAGGLEISLAISDYNSTFYSRSGYAVRVSLICCRKASAGAEAAVCGKFWRDWRNVCSVDADAASARLL